MFNHYFYWVFFLFAGDFSKNAEPIFTKSSRKMASGLVSEVFRFGPNFIKRNMVVKRIYLSKKETCLILAG